MSKKVSTELTEDIEVIGPGVMLADARAKMNFSVEEVAESLNFRVCQVKDIEADCYDKSIPETFTRGYLSNYAKLVEVNVEDVLSSYDALGVAKQQGAEMQSFSKITEKQAEHSRVMWLSYLIVLVLIALTIMYYFQDANNQKTTLITDIQTVINSDNESDIDKEVDLVTNQPTPLAVEAAVAASTRENESVDFISTENTGTNTLLADNTQKSAASQNEPLNVLPAVRAIFTFAGDCWVNIQDGTGERIAYGIKKAGYVMELNGKPPFNITVGKPELVAINFNGQVVDMSKYNSGNIAKFILPETPES